MQTIDYELVRGDTTPMKKIKITVNDENIDTSDLKIYMTARKSRDSDVVISKSLENGIELEDDGYYHMTLTNSDTCDLTYGEYVYDIQIKAGDYRKTIINGTITLEDEITTNKEEK